MFRVFQNQKLYLGEKKGVGVATRIKPKDGGRGEGRKGGFVEL